MNNFNFVAPFYDFVAMAVFGHNIDKSQLYFLNSYRGDRLLILGGGTGKILTFLPVTQKVVFLDKSIKMINLARKRKTGANVDFVCQDFLSYETQETFDVIACPFFLDCFHENNLRLVVRKIKSILKPGGKLVVTDFRHNGNKWMLLLMHLFFRWMAGLESKSLKDIHAILLESGLEVEKEFFFRSNQIFSRVYGNL